MLNVPADLGERIILATRMAVIAHWEMQLERDIHTRQQLSGSGTAEKSVTDDLLPTATLGGAGTTPRRPSRLRKLIRRSRR